VRPIDSGMERAWLMKSEPDSYAYADLARDGRTAWDGVRNYQARNYMRDDMRVGDLILYYHSSTKVPAVVGLARVASEPYPDPTQFDPRSGYHDAKATREAPRWFLVDIEPVRELERPVTLAEMKADPALAGMALLARGNRLSVMPVEPEHARHVLALAAG